MSTLSAVVNILPKCYLGSGSHVSVFTKYSTPQSIPSSPCSGDANIADMTREGLGDGGRKMLFTFPSRNAYYIINNLKFLGCDFALWATTLLQHNFIDPATAVFLENPSASSPSTHPTRTSAFTSRRRRAVHTKIFSKLTAINNGKVGTPPYKVMC